MLLLGDKMSTTENCEYDIASPRRLKEIQKWFASIIVRPIDCESHMMPISPTGIPMESEAKKYIKPSWSLKPHQRIELYNQQYWWRLLNVLHDIFPVVVRLFGYTDFNQTIGFPFLVKYPPNDWSLNSVGANILEWLEEAYTESDKKLVFDAANLDLAFNQSFVAKWLKPIDFADCENNDLSALLLPQLYLQPSLYLFDFDYDLFAFRQDFLLQDPNYWQEHDFPKLQHGKKRFVLCRTPQNETVWSELSEAEFALLNQFKKGSSIENACSWLEEQEASIFEEASENLHLWFKKWASRGWLSIESPY